MHSAELVLHVYEEIAEHYQQAGDAEQRDIFLLLAADAAFNAGYMEIAEQLRLRLLTLNPHHILRPYTSFAEALQSADIQLYLEDLLRRFPPEQAPQLLEDLKDQQNRAASRDLLFAELPEVDGNDLRVFQQYDEPLPPAKSSKTPMPARPADTPKWAPAPVSTLPVSLAPPAPWLRSDPPSYETDTSPSVDAAAEGPDLLDCMIAYGLFALAVAVAAGIFCFTLLSPLLR